MSVRPFAGTTPDLGAGAYVDATALVLGDVTLGVDCSVWPMTVIRGDVNRIEIGARTNIQDGSVLHVSSDSEFMPGGFPLIIGNDVTVGHSVTLHGCTVEDLSLIGMDALVLDGAVVRSRAILGAGSLVPPGRDLEGSYLWMGRPAERIRELSKQEFAMLDYLAAHYVELKDKYLVDQRSSRKTR